MAEREVYVDEDYLKKIYVKRQKWNQVKALVKGIRDQGFDAVVRVEMRVPWEKYNETSDFIFEAKEGDHV
jgi:hypothetical protein